VITKDDMNYETFVKNADAIRAQAGLIIRAKVSRGFLPQKQVVITVFLRQKRVGLYS
jgi:hypothetical protein